MHGQFVVPSTMSVQVSVAAAKVEFASLVSRAEKGEQIVVTRNGRPVACLGPLPEKKPVVYGDLRGLWIADDLSLPQEIFDEIEKSVEALAQSISAPDSSRK
jgi:prevent-host-death family protein